MQKNKELFEHYKFVANRGQTPLRVDKFLMNFIEHATRTKIQNAATEGNIKVNSNVVKSNYKVKAGDIVTVEYTTPKKEFELVPEDIPLNIVYEDDDFLIVNKDAGMVVHPGFGNYSGTLVNALAFHFNNLPNLGEENRPGLVHRIDKNTSGILVIAKTENSMTILAQKFAERELNRKYIALVWGNVTDQNGCQGSSNPFAVHNIVLTSNMNGLSNVLQNQVETYSVTLNPTSTYSWELTGGILQSGIGTNSVDVFWNISGQGMIFVIETDINGCIGDTVSLAVTVFQSTGMTEDLGKQISIYPNPFTESTIISIGKIKSTYSLTLYDVTGQNVWQEKNLTATEFELEKGTLNKGVYFLEIETKEIRTLKKLVIQ